MCGRIAQKHSPIDYAEVMRWNPYQLGSPNPLGGYNVPPGTRPLVLHTLQDKPDMDRVFWGYSPAWYSRSPVSNARLNTLLDPGKSFWRMPLRNGRIVVPADGWYEWTVEAGQKRPWFIRPKDGKPLMMAAVSGWFPGAEAGKAHGMAIVTDDTAGGMIDIHDRRPVVLTADDARAWMDRSTSLADAKEIVTAGRPESAFVWHRVTARMNSARYQLPDAMDPLADDGADGTVEQMIQMGRVKQVGQMGLSLDDDQERGLRDDGLNSGGQ